MMKTTFNRGPLSCLDRLRRASTRAFSLVEVTLALGIVTFAMVGVVGVLPVALSTGRQSFDQNRAATIANTLFASFRSQPFSNVCYLDEQLQADGATAMSAEAGLNLNQLTQDPKQPAGSDKKFFACFIDTSANAGTDTFGEQRRLCFTKTALNVGTRYSVTLRFNNHPDGMMVDPAQSTTSPGAPIPAAQANQIEMTISPLAQPADKYRFISTVANRF